MRAFTLAITLGAALVACPPSSSGSGEKKGAPGEATQGCARVGQSCELSPGKLGTCVAKHGCTKAAPACFVCQSQH